VSRARNDLQLHVCRLHLGLGILVEVDHWFVMDRGDAAVLQLPSLLSVESISPFDA
jgi:hypothetical protein